jgi:alpha-N-arabinofuranosidase
MKKVFISLLAMGILLIPGAKASETVSIKLDLKNQGEAISPFIYGQFIEHLGRCIYGGIWAEMLEDTKFYFPITANYAPYVSLTDTGYPVVGASPWEIVGDPALVTMDKKEPFVGEHTPLIKNGAAIQQHDLAVVSGKKYVGYIWLKSEADKTGASVCLYIIDGKSLPARLYPQATVIQKTHLNLLRIKIVTGQPLK